jgi:hypothetical protein
MADDGIPQLHLAPTLSRRNGFGPAHEPAFSSPFFGPATYPLPAQDVYSQLIPLLQSYSLTEECSIRQITSFVYVVLLQNNIGSHGSASCIWKNSKLALLLPNLPVEMRIIVVTYRVRGCAASNTPSSMKSYRFWRHKIERGLYLLDQTKLLEWKGKLCPERLSSWPEAGRQPIEYAWYGAYGR